MKPSVVCLGDNCIDRYEEPVRRRFVGGNAVNTAVFAAATGAGCAYAGAVGNDPEGKAVKEKLQEKGIDISMVQVYPSETAWTDVHFEEKERIFGEEFYDTVKMFQVTDEVLERLSEFGIIHHTLLGGTEKELERIHRHCPGLQSMDFGERYTRDFLDQCITHLDLAFFSTDDPNVSQAETFVRDMSRRGPALVVETMGKYGAVCYSRTEGCLFEPARKIEIVDTLGAGDTFIGTFLGMLAQGKTLPDCMKQATNAAAKSCLRSGGFDGCEIFI